MQRQVTTLPVIEKTVANGNWDSSRSTIDRIVIHTMVGTAQAADTRFNNPSQQVSAHYGVLLNGTLWHWVDEDNTAYAAGDYAMNQRSINIEHEDNGDYNGTRPDSLYTTSAKLVADICAFYNIPIDRQHILKHSEVSDNPTGCPDALDIDRIVKQAQGGGSVGDNVTRKSSFFDQIWLHRYGNQTNTDNATQQQVTDYNSWVDSNVKRAGEWDQLCLKLGFTGDTNQVTIQQILDKMQPVSRMAELEQIRDIAIKALS